MILRKLLARIYRYYARNGFGSEQWKSQFAYFGKDAEIRYPAIVSVNGGLSIGDGTIINMNSRIQNYPSYFAPSTGPHIYIGSHCNIGYYFTILNASTVTIGNNVLIASHVMISSENHGMDPDLDYVSQPLISKPVTIGDGCWIGEKVCILPGVTIGKKCIVGAGSVVTKSIPNYSMAVGNPAKIIKHYDFDKHKWEKTN